MIQNLTHPYTVQLFAITSVAALMSFIGAHVLASAPAISFAQPSVARSEEIASYSGVIAWVSQNSLEIVDSSGVSRVFDINESTNIQGDSSQRAHLRYSDLQILEHVRVNSYNDGKAASAIDILVH